MAAYDKSKRHPNWDLADALLRRSFPGSVDFDPDHIPALRSPSAWQPFPMESRNLADITDDLVGRCVSQLSPTLVLVTLVSYLPTVGPFFLERDTLPRFVAEYPEKYNDAFVTGSDVSVLSLESGSLIVVHHNEYIAHATGHPAIQ